jgi:hypothetical protein
MALAVPIDARPGPMPPRLRVRARDSFAAADAKLDRQLRYRPPHEVDRRRFANWARRAGDDARAGRRAALRGDVATLTWIRDRFAHTLRPVARVRLDRWLTELEEAVADGDVDRVDLPHGIYRGR